MPRDFRALVHFRERDAGLTWIVVTGFGQW